MFWNTYSNGGDNSFAMEQSIKYGITNSFVVESAVLEPNIRDGGDQGTGDLELTLFKRFVKEVKGGDTPDMAGIVRARFPTSGQSRNTNVLVAAS